MKTSRCFWLLTTLIVLLVIVVFMLAVPQSIYAASSSSPRWDGLWMSGGLSVGSHSFNADYGPYLDLSDSGSRSFLDVKVGRGFSPRMAAFMHGIMSGTDSNGATINLMLRPSTASSFFIFGGVGYYNPGSVQTAISAGLGLDIWRLSLDARGFVGVGENTQSSAVSSNPELLLGTLEPIRFLIHMRFFIELTQK